jgi:two-component system, NtrC family, response regulator
VTPEHMSNILIVDDDESMCSMLAQAIRKAGHQVQCAFTLDEGLQAVSSSNFDLVFLDVHLPDGSGLDALPSFTKSSSAPEVIIITGAGDANGAELAIRSGAWDYIQKPASVQSMTLPLRRALQYREEKLARSGSSTLMAVKRTGIVGNSPQILSCFDQVARVAPTDTNILITGETGTGKELFAQAVHQNSPRHDKSFVVLDCSVLPEMLVESILFGHAKGAFTSADRARDGLIRQAHGGTLFLDEVGELPPNIQKAFLRVLQERRFRPLGSQKEITSDFRLVVATNRNLSQMVAEGRFRDDLLFRLRSFVIELPPLRDRTGDVKDLAMHHLARVCERLKIGLKGLAPEFMEALNSYGWPGNVRELMHAVERAVASALYEHTLYVKHLPAEIRISLARDSLSRKGDMAVPTGQPPKCAEMPLRFKDYRKAMDRQYFLNLMAGADGNVRRACELSGLSRSRFYTLLKLHNLPQHNESEVS